MLEEIYLHGKNAFAGRGYDIDLIVDLLSEKKPICGSPGRIHQKTTPLRMGLQIECHFVECLFNKLKRY